MRGGLRAGAGRKKGFSAMKAEEARAYFAERVATDLRLMVDVLLEKAKKGDIQAIRELFDRAWGRPHQSATFGTDGISPLVINFDKSFEPSGHE